jgi:flagellar biosynthetic protein FliR
MIEPIIGAFLGLLLRTFVFSLRIAGAIASQAVSLSQFMGSPSSEPSTTISEFLTLGGISILFALGLPVQIFHFLDLSYGIFPMSGSMLLALNTEFLIGHYDYIMKQALVLAMPFLILSLLYNVALGVINKAMPQLMVMLVGAPAITGLGLLLLASVSIALLSNWSRTFTEFLSLSSVGGL